MSIATALSTLTGRLGQLRPGARTPSLPAPYVNGVPRLQTLSILFQACNLTCPMCSMNVNNTDIGQVLRDYPNAATGRPLRLDEYMRICADLREHRPNVSIAGGEPTYFPYLVDLVEYIRNDLGYGVGITTNGTLLDDSKIDRLAKCGIGVTVSIDGLEDMNDSIRGIGSFGKAVRTLRRMIEQRAENPTFAASSLFCIQESNYHEMEAVAEFNIDELGVGVQTMSYYIFAREDTLQEHEEWRIRRGLADEFKIDILHGGEAAKSDFERFDFEAIFATQTRLKERYGRRINFEPDFRSLDDLKRYFLTNKVMESYFGKVCGPAHFVANLISNGDVLFYPQCFQIKLGNVREQGILEVWEGEKMRKIRKLLTSDLSPICAHCCANRVQKTAPFLKELDLAH